MQDQRGGRLYEERHMNYHRLFCRCAAGIPQGFGMLDVSNHAENLQNKFVHKDTIIYTVIMCHFVHMYTYSETSKEQAF